MLAAFGAFDSGRATAELLASCVGFTMPRAATALHELVDESLVKRAPKSSCYEMHDLTLSYAKALRRDAATADDSATIHAVRQYLKAHTQDYAVLEPDLDNILGLASRAATSDAEAFVSIIEAIAVGGYLDDHGHTLALLRLLDQAIETVRGWDGPYRERLHYLVGKRANAAYHRGEFAAAVDAYREALAFAPTPQRRAIVLGGIGKALAELGRHEEADKHFVEAYDLTRRHEDDHGTLRVLEQHS